MKIVTKKNKLTSATEKVSVEEGEVIAKQLIKALDGFGGVGLAANQVGINKSVCVVNCRKDEEPKVLINPRCVSSSDDRVMYIEGCLSIPGKRVKTIRHKTVKVACDNWVNEIEFGPDTDEFTDENYWEDEGLLECVCIQHEIGHLNGELMTDPEIKYKQPPLRSQKFGRNEKVMLSKDGETQFVKYKKAEALLADGWEII